VHPTRCDRLRSKTQARECRLSFFDQAPDESHGGRIESDVVGPSEAHGQHQRVVERQRLRHIANRSECHQNVPALARLLERAARRTRRATHDGDQSSWSSRAQTSKSNPRAHAAAQSSLVASLKAGLMTRPIGTAATTFAPASERAEAAL
jgi:hypothetical protein